MNGNKADYLVDGKYAIGDLVNMNQLKTVFEKFTEATGFTIGFLDHPGKNVLIATGWRDICTKFHRSCPVSVANCAKSNAHLLDNLNEPRQLVIEECDNGLVDCATPIIVKGKHIASLATGQLLLAPPDIDRFKRQAREFGFDEREYLDALKEIPVVDSEKLKQVTGFLGEIAHIVSDLGYVNLESKDEAMRLAQEIRERQKAEEALREAQEQLVQRERMAVLGQLADGVGHELRHPLGSIKNIAYFLNMAIEKPEPEVKESIQILDQEVAVCERIINSLLDYATPKPSARRRVDIEELVRQALSRVMVPANVTVANMLSPTSPAVLGDPDQLGQVFENIIMNAVEAMPDGGRLTITAKVSSPEWAAVSVADTGVGIPPDKLTKVFEPLFTTKAKGIGLGLAVSKTLVDADGGGIEVQSEAGKGSSFTIKLPLCKEREG